MPMNRLPRRFNGATFESHLIKDTEDTSRFSFQLFEHEEAELGRLEETEFKTTYYDDYQKASAQAEDKWYPYRAAGIVDELELCSYQETEIACILASRRSEIQKKVRTQYFNVMLSELCRALERRTQTKPKYETEWSFRVKSKGEQAVANALRFYTVTDPITHECRRITLLYEPLFRFPEENRVNIPDFAIPEYGLVIEYAGFEERDYKFGLYMKECAFRKLGIPFVIMRPEDLDDVKKSLNQKLAFYYDFTLSETMPILSS